MRALLLAALLTASPVAFAERYRFEPDHTYIGFEVSYLRWSKVQGKFSRSEGVLDLDPAALERSHVDFSIETASISTGRPRRDKFLRGPRFFDTGRFPAIRFRSTRVEAESPTRGIVYGDLTLKGKTRPVALRVRLSPVRDGRIDLFATTTLSRTEFDMTAYSAFVGDRIRILIDARATRVAP